MSSGGVFARCVVQTGLRSAFFSLLITVGNIVSDFIGIIVVLLMKVLDHTGNLLFISSSEQV